MRINAKGDASALIDALGISGGIVCFVGAGGKKSAMLRIAESYPGRVAITTTAHIERFPQRYRDVSVLADGKALYDGVCALRDARIVAFARRCDLPGRHAGVSNEDLLTLYRDGGFDLCLVKADGARGRVIKAPAPHEPALSPDSALVVPVVSARAIGMPLNEKLAHRPETLASVAGAAIDEPLTPEHVGRLLASGQGSLKDVGAMPVVPIINMVDDPQRELLARQAAEVALSLTDRFERVVLASMKRPQPLVAVVTR